MRHRLMAIVLPIAAVATILVAPAASASHAQNQQLNTLRHVTDKFHSVATAEEHGYTMLKDKNGISCIAMPGMGGMGVHWVKSKLVGDPAIALKTPEALVYAPASDGTLRLAAIEYVVLKSDWDANHSSRPSLFGKKFNFTPDPNRFGLPAYYSLHVWVWQHNSAGMFSPWNPAVHCHH